MIVPDFQKIILSRGKHIPAISAGIYAIDLSLMECWVLSEEFDFVCVFI